MPIYTYVCTKCGKKFDLLVGVTFEKVELKCKKCGSKNIERAFSMFSIGKVKEKLNSSGGTCPTGTCNLYKDCQEATKWERQRARSLLIRQQ